MKDPTSRAGGAPIFSEFTSDPQMAGLVAQFVEELPDRVAAILNDWTTQNFPAVQRGAHQLKGASAGYGFPAIGLAAERLESDLRGRSADQIAADASRIGDDIRALADLCHRAAPRP